MGYADKPAWERRSLTGAMVATGGGLLMAAGSYLPWLSGGGGVGSLTGMDLYDLRHAAGDNPFVVDQMFKSTFDPFFTGAVTLTLGVLVALFGLAMVLLPKRSPPSKYRVNPALYYLDIALLLLAFLVVFVNGLSLVTTPDGTSVSFGVGLFAVAVGMVAGWVGVTRAGAATKAQLASGAPHEMNPPMAPPQPPPPPPPGGAPVPLPPPPAPSAPTPF